MVIIACAGWVSNFYSAKAFPNRSDLTSAIGSFVVGTLGHIYGRFTNGSSFPVTVVGILFQLPSGLSNGGIFSFASENQSGSGNAYSDGFQVAEQLVSVAIGLTYVFFHRVALKCADCIGSDCSSVRLLLIRSEVEEREDLVFSLSSPRVYRAREGREEERTDEERERRDNRGGRGRYRYRIWTIYQPESKQTYETLQIIRTFFTCINYHNKSHHINSLLETNRPNGSVILCISYTENDGFV